MKSKRKRPTLLAAARGSAIPRDKWEWFGNAGHLCVSNWCRYHLTTKIGKHLVSTVGEYYQPHATEHDCPKKPTTIGCDRTYETMVFAVEGMCECGCGLPTISGSEIECDGYNDPKSATAGHNAMCERVAGWPNDKAQTPRTERVKQPEP
jgi:hypothetical protein